jgi:lysozyme
MNKTRLRNTLIRHEGLKLLPYECTAGKLTLGVGRNIEDRGISKETAMQMLDEDIEICLNELMERLNYFETLPTEVQETLVNLCFNMGISRLMKFQLMLGAMEAGQYELAAKELLDSRYARQVGKRAEELADILRQQQE